MAHSCDDILVIASAPISDISSLKFIPVAAGASEIGLKEEIPLSGIVLPCSIKSLGVDTRRSTMDLDNQGIFFPFLKIHRIDQQPFYFQIIETLPANDLCFSQLEVLYILVESGQLFRLILRGEGGMEFCRMRSVGVGENHALSALTEVDS